MKTINPAKLRLVRAFGAAALLACVLATDASNITYTYDAAGRLVAGNYGVNTNLSYAYDSAGNLLLAAAPTPALLVAHQSGSTWLLSWPAVPSGYILQSSPAVGPTASWTDVVFLQPPIQIGNLFEATFTIAPQPAFYRLRH